MDAKRWRRALELLRVVLNYTQHVTPCEGRGPCHCGAANVDAAILRFLHPDPPYPEVEQPV